jgi:hypothetical protein
MWIKDLNIRPENRSAGNSLETIGIGKEFLSRTAVDQQLRQTMDKWYYMKLKIFCTIKEMVSKLKRPPAE